MAPSNFFDLELAKNIEALPTLNTKIRYQLSEVRLQITPRRKTPRARLKPSGTKAGRKATAITAALTFVKLVVNPVLIGDELDFTRSFWISNFDEFFER